VLDLLDAPDAGAIVRGAAPRKIGEIAQSDAVFAPPILHPGKVICLGLNYRSHLVELFGEGGLPEHPTLFAKFADTLLGAAEDIRVPDRSIARTVDWEAELAVIVGSEIFRADETEAARAIAGYTVANDISMRDWQERTTQWFQGKAWDRTMPIGPMIVTADEFSDGVVDLEITCRVNGELKQSSRTGELLFGPARALSYISTFTALRAGDIVLTGTPGGVGLATGEPDLLGPGDRVDVEIAGLGRLSNRIVGE
jgi:2-keto-4-pentenoate hydratase/2-oxohepta-3-ene-1,7-dioic acid hydratase in catechol pathway